MQCSRCRFMNPEGMTFCGKCGTRLSNSCPQCGFENPLDFTFCGKCGTPLTSPTSVPDPPEDATAPERRESQDFQPTSQHVVLKTPEAERRQLTVMFCDLVGSTDLSSRLDPEDLRVVVRAYQETAAEAIGRYEGHIAQYLGDGLLVYFGFPVAHEDDAQRAVYTGLGILAALPALNARLHHMVEALHNKPLQVRVGINTGPVVVGEIGGGARHENLALGESPNLAARLEDVAAPDTVVISPVTFRLVEGYFACQDLGLYTFKGVSTPMQVYRVLGESGVKSRLQAAALMGLTPWVGRQQEAKLLLERWEQVKAGMGQVVLLSGEAGIGKSRLVQLLKDHVAGETHSRLECHSSPHYQNTAFYPVIDLLQWEMQFADDETADAKLTKLERILNQYWLPLADTVPLFAALLSIPLSADRYPPLGLSPNQQRQKTLQAILAILLEQAEQQPVLLILEDLHWADPSTLELLGLLIDQGPTARIMSLLTYRPTFQPPWAIRAHLTHLTLNSLSPLEIELMIERLTGGKRLPPDVLQELMAKTDGVPLYVEEMTKAVLESGLLQESTGHYELTGPLPALSIPATLHDSLMARLDRLDTAKGIAQLGATIGRQFPYELLQAMTPLNEQALQRELHHLVEAELLYQRGLPPQAMYVFKHALIQDAAYQSLLTSIRQQYHRQIAQVLEERFAETAETHPELIAHHAFHGAVWDKAIEYFRQAGTQAASRSAYREAVTCFEKALTTTEHLPESQETLEAAFNLRMELTRRLVPLADYNRILDNLRDAEAVAEAQGDRRQLGLVHSHMTDYLRLTGNSEQAVASGERVLALATELGDFSLQVLAHQRLGFACHAIGDYRRAIQLFKWNIASLHDELIYERFGAGSLPSVFSRSYMVFSLVDLGEFAEAVYIAEEAIQIASDADTVHSQLLAAHSLGLVYLYKGDFDRAIPLLEQTFHRAQIDHVYLDTRLLASALGYAYVLSEQVAKGISLLQQAIQQAEERQVLFRYALWLVWLGEAYLLASQVEDALDLAERAHERACTYKELGHQAYALRLLGEIAVHGDLIAVEKAETAYQQALALANSQGMCPLQAHCHLGLGTLYHKEGLLTQARNELSAAVELFSSMDMTFWQQRANALLVEMD